MHSDSVPLILPPYSSHHTTSHLTWKTNLFFKDQLYLFVMHFFRNAVITTVYDSNNQFALDSFSPDVKTFILWLGCGKTRRQLYAIFTSLQHSVISFKRKWNSRIYLSEKNNYWRVTPYLSHFLPLCVSSGLPVPFARGFIHFISLSLASAGAAVPRAPYTSHAIQYNYRRFHYPHKCLILFWTPLSSQLHWTLVGINSTG